MFRNGLNMRPMAAPVIVLALALGFSAAPASAAKPAGVGNAKEEHARSSKKDERKGRSKKENAKPKKAVQGKHFRDQDEDVVRRFYRDEFRGRKDCPPGLARKDNGCMPPGQARKQWTTGEPLPDDVVYHDLPRPLLSKLPEPPGGQRYVRLLSDILLVDLDSDVVIDAIVDLAIP